MGLPLELAADGYDLLWTVRGPKPSSCHGQLLTLIDELYGALFVHEATYADTWKDCGDGGGPSEDCKC